MSEWRGLLCDLPDRKESLYATNAIKVYTGEEYKESSSIPDSLIDSFAPVWRAELELMACHGCLPHLIVVFGQRIWETHWRSLHLESARSQSFRVRDYRPAGSKSSAVYHHANRIVLEREGGRHTMLLARLYHPSARARRDGPPRRDAKWLLAQPEFLELASLRTDEEGSSTPTTTL